MRCRWLVLAIVLLGGVEAATQSPTYKLGRAPTRDELHPVDAAVSPNGDELPPGSGTAKRGEVVFLARGCGNCHGPTGIEGPGPILVEPFTEAGTDSGGARPRANPGHEEHTMGRSVRPSGYAGRGVSRMPFAPLLWSWINKAMPLGQQGYLTTDEVYSLTAYLLYRNGIVKEADVMDAKTLPQVQMPNRKGYVPPPYSEWKPGLIRLFPF